MRELAAILFRFVKFVACHRPDQFQQLVVICERRFELLTAGAVGKAASRLSSGLMTATLVGLTIEFLVVRVAEPFGHELLLEFTSLLCIDRKKKGGVDESVISVSSDSDLYAEEETNPIAVAEEGSDYRFRLNDCSSISSRLSAFVGACKLAMGFCVKASKKFKLDLVATVPHLVFRMIAKLRAAFRDITRREERITLVPLSDSYAGGGSAYVVQVKPLASGLLPLQPPLLLTPIVFRAAAASLRKRLGDAFLDSATQMFRLESRSAGRPDSLLAKFVLALAPASSVEIPDLVAVHIRGLVKERINVVMAKSLTDLVVAAVGTAADIKALVTNAREAEMKTGAVAGILMAFIQLSLMCCRRMTDFAWAGDEDYWRITGTGAGFFDGPDVKAASSTTVTSTFLPPEIISVVAMYHSIFRVPLSNVLVEPVTKLPRVTTLIDRVLVAAFGVGYPLRSAELRRVAHLGTQTVNTSSITRQDSDLISKLLVTQMSHSSQADSYVAYGVKSHPNQAMMHQMAVAGHVAGRSLFFDDRSLLGLVRAAVHDEDVMRSKLIGDGIFDFKQYLYTTSFPEAVQSLGVSVAQLSMNILLGESRTLLLLPPSGGKTFVVAGVVGALQRVKCGIRNSLVLILSMSNEESKDWKCRLERLVPLVRVEIGNALQDIDSISDACSVVVTTPEGFSRRWFSDALFQHLDRLAFVYVNQADQFMTSLLRRPFDRVMRTLLARLSPSTRICLGSGAIPTALVLPFSFAVGFPLNKFHSLDAQRSMAGYRDLQQFLPRPFHLLVENCEKRSHDSSPPQPQWTRLLSYVRDWLSSFPAALRGSAFRKMIIFVESRAEALAVAGYLTGVLGGQVKIGCVFRDHTADRSTFLDPESPLRIIVSTSYSATDMDLFSIVALVFLNFLCHSILELREGIRASFVCVSVCVCAGACVCASVRSVFICLCVVLRIVRGLRVCVALARSCVSRAIDSIIMFVYLMVVFLRSAPSFRSS